MRILISSVGRRVGLVGCFRESLREHGVAGEILAVDVSRDAPAIHFVDRFWRVPRCDDPRFPPEIAGIVQRERVDLVVPTIDTELPIFARTRNCLENAGAQVCVSDPAAIAICADKRRTHVWLCQSGLPAPRQFDIPLATESARVRFPVILKPRRGSGSVGVRRVYSHRELQVLAEEIGEQRLDEWTVEEMAPGDEYTVNVLVDSHGVCRSAVPHRRVEVRAGEVSKAVTVKHEGLMRLARSIAESLPGARGPLSIQCFLNRDGGILVTEINARFGGGYPLTHRSGARFTDWIVNETLGIPVRDCNGWTDGLTMLRYDREVFLRDEAIASGAELRPALSPRRGDRASAG